MSVLEEVDVITDEAIKEESKRQAEENVIPKGTWEGLVLSWNKVDDTDLPDDNIFKGVPLYRVGVTHYDCPELGKKKTQWYKFTTVKVLGPSGRPKTAYTAAVGLCKAMGMAGAPFTEVLEQAKVTRAKYRVGEFIPEGKDVPMNFLQGVSAV
jgi:hypothetical protein